MEVPFTTLGGRASAEEAERLMRSVFQHHPQAKEKLKDLQHLGQDALAAVPCGENELKSTIRFAQEPGGNLTVDTCNSIGLEIILIMPNWV